MTLMHYEPSFLLSRYQSTDLGIKKIMENNFEDRLLSTFSRMLEILEKYSDYGSPKKFVEEKKNSELQSARKDVVKEEIEDVDSDEQEEVEDETEVGEIANGEAVMKWENEVANKVFCVEAGIMEEQKSHPNKIKVENQEKPAHVLGSSKEEINGDYTWDQFFQGGFAFEAEQWRSALFFTMAMIDEVEDSSHSNWVLIRVYKAHCGRSPILDWKGKLVGLYGKLLQSPSKKARMWSSTSNKTILISSNPTARIVQLMWVEDAQNSADCFSINEPYRVPCLVLAALGFENWKRANWKVLLEGYSKSTQLWYLLIHVIKLLCFLWYFHEVLHLLDTEFEKGHSSIEKECIFMVLFFAFLEVYAVKLEFSCASSITHCEELKWLQILNILFSQYDPKEGISESIGIFPVVSHHSSLENFCVVEDEKYVATKTMTWDFVANGFSTGEWFQTDIIHQRLSGSYYNVIREVLKFLEEFLRLFEHSNSIGAKREKWEVRLGNADLDDLSFLVVQALKLLCFLSYIQEVFYFLVTKAEKDGQLTIENKVIGNSLLSDLLGARLMDRKGLSWFLPLPMSKPNKSDVGNFHGAHDCVPAAMAIKRTIVVEMPLIATSCQY